MEAPSAPPSAPRAADLPNMCLACGQMLAGTEAKCPSCGAPIRGRRPSGRSGKLTVAAVLFLGLFLLTATQVGIALIAPENPTEDAGFGPTFEIRGTVRHENGTAAPGVRVAVDGKNESQAFTDENGTYSLDGVRFGYRNVSFEAPNHTRVVYRLFLRAPETLDATLSPGAGVQTLTHASYEVGRLTLRVIAVLYAVVALVLLGAAVACLRRRGYVLALTGAWMSLLEAIPSAGITLVITLILIVLVIRSKREFP